MNGLAVTQKIVIIGFMLGASTGKCIVKPRTLFLGVLITRRKYKRMLCG